MRFYRGYAGFRRQLDTVNRSLHREVEAFDTPDPIGFPSQGFERAAIWLSPERGG